MERAAPAGPQTLGSALAGCSLVGRSLETQRYIGSCLDTLRSGQADPRGPPQAVSSGRPVPARAAPFGTATALNLTF